MKFVLCLIVISFSLTMCGAVTRWKNTALYNTVDYIDQKIDDRTSYETRKEVEDTCRSYISSYKTNKLTYEQYKDSDSELERSWGQSAKMQANKTATIYNEYILKNSFVFEGNIPDDILKELPILE